MSRLRYATKTPLVTKGWKPSNQAKLPAARPRLRRFSELSPLKHALVRLFPFLNFGQVQGLLFRNTNPVFIHQHGLLADTKLDTDEGPRPEYELPEFVLCDEVCRVVAGLDEFQNGVIARIDVRTAVPRLIFVRYIPGAPSLPIATATGVGSANGNRTCNQPVQSCKY